MQSIPCDIVLLPDPTLAQRAVTFSEQLTKYETVSTLHANGPVPHVSLYMTQLKAADMERAQKLLADIAAHTRVFNLTANGYWLNARYFDADYARTDELIALQTAVVDAINPIRDGMRKKDKPRLLSAEGLARENLEKYGYPNIGELFRPHMTLTRFADEQLSIDAIEKPNAQTFAGTFDRLGLFAMGENGTCIRKIAEFQLKKQE